jgi:hypothetical protein
MANSRVPTRTGRDGTLHVSHFLEVSFETPEQVLACGEKRIRSKEYPLKFVIFRTIMCVLDQAVY